MLFLITATTKKNGGKVHWKQKAASLSDARDVSRVIYPDIVDPSTSDIDIQPLEEDPQAILDNLVDVMCETEEWFDVFGLDYRKAKEEVICLYSTNDKPPRHIPVKGLSGAAMVRRVLEFLSVEE